MKFPKLIVQADLGRRVDVDDPGHVVWLKGHKLAALPFCISGSTASARTFVEGGLVAAAAPVAVDALAWVMKPPVGDETLESKQRETAVANRFLFSPGYVRKRTERIAAPGDSPVTTLGATIAVAYAGMRCRNESTAHRCLSGYQDQREPMTRFERFFRPVKWSMALLLAALVTGCGGGSDSDCCATPSHNRICQGRPGRKRRGD